MGQLKENRQGLKVPGQVIRHMQSFLQNVRNIHMLSQVEKRGLLLKYVGVWRLLHNQRL